MFHVHQLCFNIKDVKCLVMFDFIALRFIFGHSTKKSAICVPHRYIKLFYFCNEYLMNFLLFGNVL